MRKILPTVLLFIVWKLLRKDFKSELEIIFPVGFVLFVAVALDSETLN